MATTKLNATRSTSRAADYAEKRAVEKSNLDYDVDYVKSSFKTPHELYDKTDGNQGHVIIQSLKPDEVTPEQCNQLGLGPAERLAPNHQVAVYTHSDTDHVHSHIVTSLTDLETGKEFSNNKQALRNIRNFNDEIYREHGLNMSERNAVKLRHTQAEKTLMEKDQHSWKDGLREKIENVKDHASDFKSFSEHLEKSGIKFKVRGKNISYKPENISKRVCGKTLGEDCGKEASEYELERREREKEKGSKRDVVAAYIDQSEVDWDAVECNTEQLRKTRIRRTEKVKQAHHQVSNRDTRESERTRERTRTAHTEFDRGDEGFSRQWY